MRVLGLCFSGHGSSICLVEDGKIACAVNLERLTRVKFSVAALPEIGEALGGVFAAFGQEEVPPVFDFYEVFPRMLEYVTAEKRLAKAGIDLVVGTHDNIRPSSTPNEMEAYQRFLAYFADVPTYFDLEHHLCHAYQAYLSSPFEEAAILTIDGTGEGLARKGGEAISASLCVGTGNRVRVLSEVPLPYSLGGLYSTVTRHLGFREEQEGNTMALAAFGGDRFHRTVADAPVLHPSGTFEFRLDDELSDFTWRHRLREYCPRRTRQEPLTDVHKDVAWACQAIAEAIVVNAADGVLRRAGLPRLAMAGGVALNCVANAKILANTPVEQLYVMPNAGDRGLAAGAALYGYHVHLGQPHRHPPEHDYLGRTYSEAEIVAALRSASAIEYRKCDDVTRYAASLIASGHIVGWVQGGCEFGPRALGHRSILGDPRSLATKERLDRDIKRREWFRPYAPSVLLERAAEFFDVRGPSPYMLQAVQARPIARERIPGVVHVDGTVRLQTVDRGVEPLYHRLISRFCELTSIPVLLNTSFNGYGEPIVETPEDALRSMLAMGLDGVFIGDYFACKLP